MAELEKACIADSSRDTSRGRQLTRFENMFNLSPALAAIVVSVLGFVGLLGPLEHQIPAITLLLTGLIASYLVFTLTKRLLKIEAEAHAATDQVQDLHGVAEALGSLLGAEQRDGRLVRPPYMRRKTEDVPDVQTQALAAREIWALCVTGHDLVDNHGAFLARRCKDGCRLRVLLADENSDALQIWGRWYELNSGSSGQQRNVRQEVIGTGEQLSDMPGHPDVKYLSDFIPFAMFATDPEKPTGEIVVAFLTYRGFSDGRPYVHVTAHDNPEWFHFFVEQFKDMWKSARPRNKHVDDHTGHQCTP